MTCISHRIQIQVKIKRYVESSPPTEPGSLYIMFEQCRITYNIGKICRNQRMGAAHNTYTIALHEIYAALLSMQ